MGVSSLTGANPLPRGQIRNGAGGYYFLKPHPGPAIQHPEAWVVVVVAVHAIGWVRVSLLRISAGSEPGQRNHVYEGKVSVAQGPKRIKEATGRK